MTIQTSWTPEREKQAILLWKKGRSALEISQALRGVTRGAVCGKLFRLGYQRDNPRKSKSQLMPRAVRQSFAPNPKFVEVVKPTIDPALEPAPLYVDLLELRNTHCRWPIGEAPFTFCGHVPRNNSPYCDHHHARAYA